MSETSSPTGFEFRGNAREWFGIWIVNLLLSIVTIGVYSAWAKVRTKKYFANNTYLAGRNFDYHATGKQILIGRIIIIGALVTVQLAATLNAILGVILIIAVVAAYPWLVVRSTQFNARMTSYSNVRFDFDGPLGRAYLVYILYPILTALTLYGAYPFLDRAVKSYSIDNHRLGTSRFEFNAPIGPFYKAFLFAILWVCMGLGLLIATLVMMLGETAWDMTQNHDVLVLAFIVYPMLFLSILPALFLYQAMTRNIIYNSTRLEGGHQLHSNVKALTLVWIAVSNTIVALLSLGLMLPWTQVRMANYLAHHSSVVFGGPIDEIMGKVVPEGSSVGAAYTDLEGIDVGLPI